MGVWCKGCWATCRSSRTQPFVDGDEVDFQSATRLEAGHRHIVIAHDADVVSVFCGPHAPLGHEQHALQGFDLFGQGVEWLNGFLICVAVGGG